MTSIVRFHRCCLAVLLSTLMLVMQTACEAPPDDAHSEPVAAVSISPMERLPDNRAGEIVRQSIASAGGWDTWESKRSLSYTKIIRSFNDEGQVTREIRQQHQYLLHPQFKARITWMDEGKDHVIINNGEQAWKYVNGELQTSETDKNQAWNSSFGSHYVVSMPFKLTDEGVTLSFAGEESMADGSIAHRIDVVYAPGAGSAGGMHAWSYYFDLQDGRLVANLPKSEFLQSTGHSLKINVPKRHLPASEMEWKVPAHWNAFERNRARAYAIPYSAMVAMENWLMAQNYLKQGETRVSTPFEIPRRGTQIGVGFWGAGRGFLSHHLIIDNGVIGNYQIITPSTLNAAPRTPWDAPGPYEEAVMNTPILEEFASPDQYKGVDILRAIRSFDPCMPCTTHISVDGSDLMVMREVTTCACGIE